MGTSAQEVRTVGQGLGAQSVEGSLPGSATVAAWKSAGWRWVEVLDAEVNQLEQFASGVHAAAGTYAERDRKLATQFALTADWDGRFAVVNQLRWGRLAESNQDQERDHGPTPHRRERGRWHAAPLGRAGVWGAVRGCRQ